MKDWYFSYLKDDPNLNPVLIKDEFAHLPRYAQKLVRLGAELIVRPSHRYHWEARDKVSAETTWSVWVDYEYAPNEYKRYHLHLTDSSKWDEESLKEVEYQINKLPIDKEDRLHLRFKANALR